MGRFAPSPSGPLHFGSLVSALASFLDIRSQNGTWLLRIDDLDTLRAVPGSEDAILQSLNAHALNWDNPLSRQSQHAAAYQQALMTLAQQNRLFFCNCSRRSLRNQPVYPGTCRDNIAGPEQLAHYLNKSGERDHAIRIRVANHGWPVQDELQIANQATTPQEQGDYVVFRRDGAVSYQLAVVVDDMLTGVNRVVRGADLFTTTARQQQLHGWLDSAPPTWLHLPVVLNQRHTKLSKQAHSLPIDDTRASLNLSIALQLLSQRPPDNAENWSPQEVVDWAIENWRPEHLPREQSFSTFVGW